MANHTLVTIDYESFWSASYSLSKMSAIEYVFGPEFELQSAAIKIDDQETFVVFGEKEIRHELDKFDWSQVYILSHNGNEFDHIITTNYLGYKPKFYLDTLAMARPIHAKTVGGSLKALAQHYGLQAKGDLEATNTKGLRLADFTPEMYAAMRTYNKIDTEICAQLFRKLLPLTPKDEMRLIDLTIRMLVEPHFEVDTQLLRRGLNAERKRKAALLESLSDSLGLAHDEEEVRKTCASAAKFKALLESLGVEVPTKVSPTTNKEIPALAKTDQGMTDLLEHPDEVVQTAARARLGVRSTILETRIERLISMGEAYEGKLPIPLRYYGADTTGRWSGTMSVNMQNLPRVGKKPQISDVLRRSLRAPEGHQVVVADLSGIELRVNHFLWKVPSSIALYQQDRKADLYRAFAAVLFNKPEAEITKDERQLAKVAQLGLGYGVGGAKFQNVARLMGGIELTEDEAKDVTATWRQTYQEIVDGWKTCDQALTAIHDKAEMTIDPWGLCVANNDGIRTPKGWIRYPGLHKEGREWWYGSGRSRARLHGPKTTENLVQHLSRFVMTDAMLGYMDTEIGKHCPIKHTVHDELILIAPDDFAQEALDTLQHYLRTPPTWWPELVTYSEGAFAQDYGSVEK